MADYTGEDIPYDPPPAWIRGKSICWHRERDGTPPDQEWLDGLYGDERSCVDAWMKEIAG